MRLATKLILGNLRPVALIWVVAFYAGTACERGLRDSIERNSAMKVHALMDVIDRDMGGWIREWQSYLQNPLVLDALDASEAEFAECLALRGPRASGGVAPPTQVEVDTLYVDPVGSPRGPAGDRCVPRAAPTQFHTVGERYDDARGDSRRSWAVVRSGAVRGCGCRRSYFREAGR